MAQQGFYADPPSRRMAYDEDGTIVLTTPPNSNTLSEVNTTNKRIWNSESHTATVSYGGDDPFNPIPKMIMIFPELRDVTHMYRNTVADFVTINNHNITIEASTDTTTGLDGVWSAVASINVLSEVTNPNFRTRIQVVGANGVKAIRYTGAQTGQLSLVHYCQWHVYGHKSAGQSPHRIDFVDVSGDNLNIDFDYGDQARNTSRIWQPSDTFNQGSGIYLRNRSTTKQAQNVSVTFEALTGDMPTWLGLSKDNVTYGSSVSYTTINPLQTVGPIYVRHFPTNSAVLGVKTARLQATVGTWL